MLPYRPNMPLPTGPAADFFPIQICLSKTDGRRLECIVHGQKHVTMSHCVGLHRETPDVLEHESESLCLSDWESDEGISPVYVVARVVGFVFTRVIV